MKNTLAALVTSQSGLAAMFETHRHGASKTRANALVRRSSE
jgi:hypothetical protein